MKLHDALAGLLALSAFAAPAVAGDKCATTGSCIFTVDGESYDFSELTPEATDDGTCEGYMAETEVNDEEYRYFIGLCGNNAKACSTIESAIAQFFVYDEWEFCEAIVGYWNEEDMDVAKLDDGISLTFTNGEACWSADGDRARTTVMNMICDEELLGEISATGDGCDSTITVRTSRACAGAPAPEPSPDPTGPPNNNPSPAPSAAGLTGSEVFVLVTCLSFGLYCFIGCGFNYFTKGRKRFDTVGSDDVPSTPCYRDSDVDGLAARQIIPQYGFWCEALPNYTKAGCVTTWSCLSGLCSKDRGERLDSDASDFSDNTTPSSRE